METEFFSRKSMEFMNAIQVSTNSMDEIIKRIKPALLLIADDFRFGRITIDTLDNSIVEGKNQEKHGFHILYESDEKISEFCIEKEFTSRKLDRIIIKVYSRENFNWDSKASENIEFIMCLMATAFDRARMCELLNEAHTTDPMTGLLNADGFMQKGNQLINMGKAAAYTAFYFNLTNFKYVNKVISYQGGDRVLVLYTKKLCGNIEKDEVVGRLGGDNFVALIKNERVDNFLRFISKVKVDIDINGAYHEFVFGAVCGAYRIEKDINHMGRVMMNISTTYQAAREILHQPVVYCTPDMINNMTRGKEILMKFPTALANNEFLVYYQPKVELHSNKLAGAEALVRWRVGSEIVPPIQFLPMLERNGEICRLDFYVFETVCRDIRGWMDEKRDIPVISSNFSRWHLRDKDFVDELLRIADKYGVDHKYLEIEVTETTNIEEYSTLRDVVKKIKDNGLSVSIDDFGTGYSSLNMLKEVPVDVLKMDKSLLDQKNNPDELHANDKIMIKHIVGLASDMGIKVLSEGVETIEQREFLKNVGCDYIQGYLYDRPMPEEEFISRIKHPVYEI